MASIQTRKCGGKSGCGKELPLSSFGRKGNGHQYRCKKCDRKRRKKERIDPQQRKKEEQYRNKAENKKRKKEYDKKHCRIEETKVKRRFKANERNSSSRGKIEMNLRNNLTNFLNGSDTDLNRNLFGCTLAEFKAHIEFYMLPWMKWSNRSVNTGEFNKTWQIDHTVPYAAFQEDLAMYKKVVCWYKNVRPICANKNSIKGSKWNPKEKQALIDKYNLEHEE